jgi:hypothetical protein
MHKMSARVGIQERGGPEVLPGLPQSVLEQAEGEGEESMTNENTNKFGIVEIVLLTLICTGIALITMAAIYYYGAGAMAVAGAGLLFIAICLWGMITQPMTPYGWHK